MPDTNTHEVLVCRGPECGGKRFSADVAAQFRKLIKARGLESVVRLDSFCCFGKCFSGPNVLTRKITPGHVTPVVATAPGGRLHNGVGPADVGAILDGLTTPPAVGTAAPDTGAGALAPPRGSGDY
jgi:hypothetical protein